MRKVTRETEGVREGEEVWEARTFLGWGEIDLPSSLGKGGRLVTVSGQVGLAAGMQGGNTALER